MRPNTDKRIIGREGIRKTIEHISVDLKILKKDANSGPKDVAFNTNTNRRNGIMDREQTQKWTMKDKRKMNMPSKMT